MCRCGLAVGPAQHQPFTFWAIRLRFQREKVNPRDDTRSDMQVVAKLIGNALKAASVLENIDLWRPALTGVDMKLYQSPVGRRKLTETLKEKRERLKEGNAK